MHLTGEDLSNILNINDNIFNVIVKQLEKNIQKINDNIKKILHFKIIILNSIPLSEVEKYITNILELDLENLKNIIELNLENDNVIKLLNLEVEIIKKIIELKQKIEMSSQSTASTTSTASTASTVSSRKKSVVSETKTTKTTKTIIKLINLQPEEIKKITILQPEEIIKIIKLEVDEIKKLLNLDLILIEKILTLKRSIQIKEIIKLEPTYITKLLNLEQIHINKILAIKPSPTSSSALASLPAPASPKSSTLSSDKKFESKSTVSLQLSLTNIKNILDLEQIQIQKITEFKPDQIIQILESDILKQFVFNNYDKEQIIDIIKFRIKNKEFFDNIYNKIKENVPQPELNIIFKILYKIRNIAYIKFVKDSEKDKLYDDFIKIFIPKYIEIHITKTDSTIIDKIFDKKDGFKGAMTHQINIFKGTM
jgi:hypothetical protein